MMRPYVRGIAPVVDTKQLVAPDLRAFLGAVPDVPLESGGDAGAPERALLKEYR